MMPLDYDELRRDIGRIVVKDAFRAEESAGRQEPEDRDMTAGDKGELLK